MIYRILGKIGLLIVIIGFCMPIINNQNGFQLSEYSILIFSSVGMILLLLNIFRAPLPIFIDCINTITVIIVSVDAFFRNIRRNISYVSKIESVVNNECIEINNITGIENIVTNEYNDLINIYEIDSIVNDELIEINNVSEMENIINNEYVVGYSANIEYGVYVIFGGLILSFIFTYWALERTVDGSSK